MRKFLLTLLIVGLPGIACSQQPEQIGQQQEEQQPQAAQEQAAPEEPVLQLAEGSLSRIDSDKKFIWIKTQDGQELQFSYDDETLVEGSQETVEGLSKMSGSDLKVHYRTEGDTNFAVRIEIQGQKT